MKNHTNIKELIIQTYCYIVWFPTLIIIALPVIISALLTAPFANSLRELRRKRWEKEFSLLLERIERPKEEINEIH